MLIKNEQCLYCGGEMEPTRRSKKFCSDRCRLYHFRETSTKPSANKNRKVNATQGSQLTEQEVKVSLPKSIYDAPKLDLKNEDELPQFSTVGMNKDYPEQQTQNFDFGDDTYLVIEKYTKFPMKDRPAQRVERYKWDMEKEAYDLKIKEAWEKRRHNVSGI